MALDDGTSLRPAGSSVGGVLIAAYGVAVYVMFVLTFLYLIGFVADADLWSCIFAKHTRPVPPPACRRSTLLPLPSLGIPLPTSPPPPRRLPLPHYLSALSPLLSPSLI